MTKQPRDKQGRFLSWDGTRNRKYTRQDIENAFMAGLNNQGRFMLPSEKLAIYMRAIDGNP